MSNILQKISVRELADILGLFSVESINEEWSGLKGFKDEKCLQVAGNRGDVARIGRFIGREFNGCKQHVFPFKSDVSAGELASYDIDSMEIIDQSGTGGDWSITYLAKIPLSIIIDSDPPQKKNIEYNLPVKIEFVENVLLIRFIKFARSLKIANYDQSRLFFHKIDHEQQLFHYLYKALLDNGKKLMKIDIHKGIKTLWDSDYLDSVDLSYKTDHSRDSKKMDEKRGIKQYNLDGYNQIKDFEFLNGNFITRVPDDKIPQEFSVNWMKGFISFDRFSKTKEELDDVVRKILKNNF